jgi:pimeloyl-ACP methyl ester carboxylesterase
MGVVTDHVAASIPKATQRTIAGADHLLHLSRPREFDAAVGEALARTAC